MRYRSVPDQRDQSESQTDLRRGSDLHRRLYGPTLSDTNLERPNTLEINNYFTKTQSALCNK